MTKLLYRDRYRIPPARLSTHDYSAPGWYFITICTNIRYPWFGYIHNGIMCVNDVGSIIANEWQRTGLIRNNVELDTWVIMPDHFHAIVHITNIGNVYNHSVETHCNASLHQNVFGPQRNNLASIIRGFKGISTKRIRVHGNPQFAWQPRYHDRIMRSYRELQAVRRYIMNNPREYKKDLFNQG